MYIYYNMANALWVSEYETFTFLQSMFYYYPNSFQTIKSAYNSTNRSFILTPKAFAILSSLSRSQTKVLFSIHEIVGWGISVSLESFD